MDKDNLQKQIDEGFAFFSGVLTAIVILVGAILILMPILSLTKILIVAAVLLAISLPGSYFCISSFKKMLKMNSDK